MDQPFSSENLKPRNGGSICHFRIRYELYQFSFSGKKAVWTMKEIDLGEIALKVAINEFEKMRSVQIRQFGTRVKNFKLYKLEKIDLD